MAIKTSNQITFSEYKKIIKIEEWYLATSKEQNVSTDDEGWTTTAQAISADKKYLWNYEKTIYSLGEPDISSPIMIGIYNDSMEGKNIAEVLNFYATSQTAEINPNELSWEESTPELTPEQKFLWNYEVLVFTNNTQQKLQPHIIGVYGDSGVDAVTFEIYSTNGFVFSEDIENIELSIAAFHGVTEITQATYQWAWWDETANDGQGDYIDIGSPSTDKQLTIYQSDIYAFKNLRCTMLYNQQSYYDYATLSQETVVYSAIPRFFKENNILESGESYIVVYLDLYRNNELIETIQTHNICYGVSTVNYGTKIIQPSTQLQGQYIKDDLMYFVTKPNGFVYDVVLGQYNGVAWQFVSTVSDFQYKNSVYPNVLRNILVISKEDVNKSRTVDFNIYKDNIYITGISTVVVDSGDPIVSETEPVDVALGQLWLDTSRQPSVLKIYTKNKDGEYKWVVCSQKQGESIYTSRPTMYKEGDLWILGDNETCNGYGAGTMLKAIESSLVFNDKHWVDANTTLTNLTYDIRQYFEFNATNGLKIGQQDNNFYVNISSQEMGFFDNSDKTHPNQKVVSIGNTSATINNVVVNNNAKFDCNVQFNREIELFGKLVVKKETDGSISIAMK